VSRLTGPAGGDRTMAKELEELVKTR